MKRHVALGAAIALTLSITGIALATPSSGITPVDLARGTSAAAYTITSSANTDVATQTNTFAPGGSTSGWHTHPGPVVTIVQSGTLSLWYSSDCTLRTLTAGQAIVVPGGGMYDLGRNDSATVPLVIVQTFYNVPIGGALRTDAPAPQCSTAVPAVPQDMTIVGVTGVLHGRARMAPALNITGAANTDLYIQQLTGAAGSTTGWHSHPGPVTVLVNSGALTYQHSDCTISPYPSGTAFLDPGAGNVHLARNDGTTPTVFFATYTNLPVAGAARIDAAAPACALAAAATPTPAPAASALPNAASGSVQIGQTTSLLMGTVLLLLASVTTLGLVAAAQKRRRD
jgi:quercetin dioxygenase-like cupin family protein